MPELLRSGVLILNDLGLVAHWKVIRGDHRFFEVTKKIHNGLQGAADELTEVEREAYLGAARRNAKLFQEEYDFVFLHDPQRVGDSLLARRGRCSLHLARHIDTSQPNPSFWAFLQDHLRPLDAAVFTTQAFVPPHFPLPRVESSRRLLIPLGPGTRRWPVPRRGAYSNGSVRNWIGR